MSRTSKPGPGRQPHAQLDLEHFLPYRLSVLSNRISSAIAREYSQRFALTVTEWRVMAVLGRYPGLSANKVALRTVKRRAFGNDQVQVIEGLKNGDLVVTADIPLASLVITKGATVIDPLGELLNAGNIQERLTMRNFMESLRSSGVETGGPAALSQADRQAFANQLDRLLAKKQ